MELRKSTKNDWRLVPFDRTYDMRVQAIIAFNKSEQYDGDRDAALDAAFRAMLAAAPAAPAFALSMRPGGDAQIASSLMPKLQSLLDRMANDPRTGEMFEADGDTLRDAMHLCRSVKVCAALENTPAKD